MRYLSCLILLIMIPVGSYASEVFEYGIVRGNTVSLYSKPDVKSRAIRQMLLGEIVYSIERTIFPSFIGKDYGYWCKVETQEGKSGWIFGLYLNVIDANREDGKKQKQIIDALFSTYRPECKQTKINNGTMNIRHLFEFGDIGQGHWLLKYAERAVYTTGKEYVDPPKSNLASIEYYTMVFLLSDNTIMCVIPNPSYVSDWCMIDKYLIEYGVWTTVYSTDKRRNYKLYPTKDEYGYSVKSKIELNKYAKYDEKEGFLTVVWGSFDVKQRIETVYIKNKKTNIIDIKKFKFESGEFFPVTDDNKK